MSPSHEDVRLTLERICASEQLRQSRRLRAFLSYVVNETLEGRGERIKSYSIGLEVFGRHHGEDEMNHNFVRTAAIRLRDALEKYYQSEGMTDTVIISLPKGRYVPEFTLRQVNSLPVAKPPEQGDTDRIPSKWPVWLGALAFVIVAGIAVGIGFRVLGSRISERGAQQVYLIVEDISAGDTSPPRLAESFSNLLAQKLVGFGAARIIGPLTQDTDQWSKALAKIPQGESLLLSKTLDVTTGGMAVSWRLANVQSHVILWAGEARTSQGGAMGLSELADQVAFRILGPQGAVSMLQGHWDAPPETGLASCTPRSQTLTAFVDQAYSPETLQCLEASLKANPDQGETWALLSQLYYLSSEREWAFGRDGHTLVAKAADAAKRASELMPDSLLAQEAQLYVAYAGGQTGLFTELADRMITRYPGDASLKARIGARLVNFGYFEKGRQLIETAIAGRQHANPRDYLQLALAAIGEGNYQEALAMTGRAEAASTYTLPLLRMIALIELGRTKEAGEQRDKLLALRPSYGNYFYQDALGRGLTIVLVDKMAASLRKAGLPVAAK